MIALILLIYGTIHLRDHLGHRPAKTAKQQRHKSSSHKSKSPKKTSESTTIVVSDALKKLSEPKTPKVDQDKEREEKRMKKKKRKPSGLTSDAMKEEQEQVLAQLALRNSMHSAMTDKYIAAFEHNRFNHLPDIVITGKKKCGTKALLTFLLQHPKIRGCREEFHWHATGDFNRDLKGFLGHIGIANEQRNINWQPGTFMISKTGNSAVWNITHNAKHVDTESIGLTQGDIDKWRREIIAIDCLCDPVKRLFSDFLHVRAQHQQKNNKPNRFVRLDLIWFKSNL